MLTATTIQIVKATAPAVAAHAEQITRQFYALLFERDPQVRAFFNPAHQRSGGQQRALAGAICAYAANIDDLGALGDAVELIAQKHCSLGIRPEHYPIVGTHLLAAVRDVLGPAATDEVIAAWGEAYRVLAGVLVGRERQIYAEQAAAPGGWVGYRPFVVDRKIRESDVVTSFYLKPQDNGPLPAFRPGQYITVRVAPPPTTPSAGWPATPRNYSLSDRPGLGHYRISVKREPARTPGTPPGVVSNHLHDRVSVGDVLHVGPPCGEFTLPAGRPTRPIVLVSGGVGLTPVLSMLKELAHRGVDVPVHFVHGTRNSRTHALADEVRAIAAARPNVRPHIVYSDPLPGDVAAGRCDATGTADAGVLAALLPGTDADYYLCGPKPFMACLFHGLTTGGVPPAQVHFEFFGPKQDLVLGTSEASAAAA